MASTLDQLLPDPDVTEHHERLVRAPPHEVESAVRTLTLRDVPVATVLALLRTIPELVVHRRRALAMTVDRPLVDQALDAGFTVLHEVPGQQLVLGLVGQMWRPGGQVVRADRAAFAAFAEPGFAKAVMDVVWVAEVDGTRVTTETRVRATDPGARRAFGRYWRVIGPFSGLIRVVLLRAVAVRAEAPPSDRA